VVVPEPIQKRSQISPDSPAKQAGFIGNPIEIGFYGTVFHEKPTWIGRRFTISLVTDEKVRN
jgi:hypothetical protein